MELHRSARITVFFLASFGLLAACRNEPDAKVHVTYWEKWTGREGEAMQAVVDAFNRSQDRIEVEYLAISAFVDRKTLVATAGGDPPDVAGIFTYNIYSFADQAALTPLDDFMRQDGLTSEQWLSRYEKVFAEICTYKGAVWALPSAPAVVALYWNKALFREAGLDPERPPTTLAELETYIEKLTKRDPKTGKLEQIGFLPQEPFWWAWAYPMWFGGQLWDGTRITADLAANEAAFDWVASLSRKYGADDINTLTSGFGKFSSPQSGFFAGKLAMTFQGAWLDNFIRQYAPGLEYGAAGFPRTPSGPADFTIVNADVLAIPRGAKHPREAWEFIKYVSSANVHAEREEDLTGMERLCYEQEKNSPLKEWSPFFEQHHPHPYIGLFRELAASPHAAIYPKIGIWQEYSRELLVVFEDVRTLRRSARDTLASCQQRVQASFSWQQQSLERHAP